MVKIFVATQGSGKPCVEFPNCLRTTDELPFDVLFEDISMSEFVSLSFLSCFLTASEFLPDIVQYCHLKCIVVLGFPGP